MKAMVLAAGLGTRLRPLTNDRPKALVEIEGRTLLEITLQRLHSFGIDEVVVNVHHFAELVIGCLKSNNNFGMRVEVSNEDVLLDTGGGLKKVAHFFRDGLPDAPFILHNVDVLSSIDLRKMVKFHEEHGGLATLAVQKRKSSRQLLFGEQLQLCGRRTAGVAEDEIVCSSQQMEPLAFAGIHVISPRVFDLMVEEHAFPIIPMYLRMAGSGENILGFRADEYYWRDLGTPASLQQAAEDLKLRVAGQ